MWFREKHRNSNSSLMEPGNENMQSRNSEAKIHLLMHMEEGSMVQQKKP